ncbi:MAG: phosphoenolpyruvate--protein phosphotransferase, partial [Gammaproteobacteria bacterium]
AILARSLGIPAVVGVHGALRDLSHGEMVVVDGREGLIIARPSRKRVAEYRARQVDVKRIRALRSRLRQADSVTADGVEVRLQANVEMPDDMNEVRRVNAAGVGLYRTEYLFMNRTEPPDEHEQYEAYARVVDLAHGAPVTVRTLDLGADKQVDGARPGAPPESNPALGLRAIRLCLREPELFRPQLRAILRASARGPVRLMVPMVSNTDEMAQVLVLLNEYRRELEREGLAFDPDMPLGAMVEVPAAAICADIFAREFDFLSIGTNDLIQYTIAIDRIDDEVNYLYDPLHPAVLRLIRGTIRAGDKAGTPVALCGEMASDTRYTRLLLGLGLREFSVHPGDLLEVKQAIAISSAGETAELAERILRTTKVGTRIRLIEQLNASLDLGKA